MKKSFALLLCSLFPFMLFAKREAEPVIAIMADGSRLDGYTKTSLINYIKPDVSTISISTEPDGEARKYTSEEVVELIFPPVEGDSTSTVAVYHAVKAQKYMPNAWMKNPKTYKKPVFLRLIYNGDHVKGYVRPALDSTHTPSMSINNYTWIYYYKLADEDITKSYWFATNDLIPNMRKTMKFYFREFPGLQKMVDDKELSPKDFREHPSIVLPLMEAEAAQR